MNQNVRFIRICTVLISLVFLITVPVSASGLQNVAFELHTATIAKGIPTAENLNVCTYKNIAYYGNFLANDPDGDSLSYQLVDKPARGSVTLGDENGTQFVYTPYENKTGKDSFTYIAIDSNGHESPEATVNIQIKKPQTKVSYVDMTNHPAHNAAVQMAEKNILVGTRMDGVYYFQPELAVQKSEFLVLAMSALGMDATDSISTGFYDDHAIETWAKPYVSSALKAGIIQGDISNDGQIIYNRTDSFSIADAAVILNNLLSIADVPIETAEFDITQIPNVACQAVLNLVSAGILPEDVTFSQELDRATAAQMLFHALNLE